MKLCCITSLAMRKKAASTLAPVWAESSKNNIWDMVLVGAGGKGVAKGKPGARLRAAARGRGRFFCSCRAGGSECRVKSCSRKWVRTAKMMRHRSSSRAMQVERMQLHTGKHEQNRASAKHFASRLLHLRQPPAADAVKRLLVRDAINKTDGHCPAVVNCAIVIIALTSHLPYLQLAAHALHIHRAYPEVDAEGDVQPGHSCIVRVVAEAQHQIPFARVVVSY